MRTLNISNTSNKDNQICHSVWARFHMKFRNILFFSYFVQNLELFMKYLTNLECSNPLPAQSVIAFKIRYEKHMNKLEQNKTNNLISCLNRKFDYYMVPSDTVLRRALSLLQLTIMNENSGHSRHESVQN
jgi:hypothetical protein